MPEEVSTTRVIALVSSSLQCAVIDRADVLNDSSIIIGHRGMEGDIVFMQSVLNDAEFFPELDRLLEEGPAEVFLPNSLSATYYFCAAHPGVRRISYVDEGRLTQRFLARGVNRPSHFLAGTIRAAFRAASRLPKSFRRLAYRLLVRVVDHYIVRPYVKHVDGYPYRTIERRWKPGRLLTHISPAVTPDWVRHVDITTRLEVDADLAGAACLFLHPKDVATDEQVDAIVKVISIHGDSFDRGLIRPHPLFALHPDRFERLKRALSKTGHDWSEVQLRGRNDVSVELYARGVRRFFVNRSTIEDTLKAYEFFFKQISVIKIGKSR